MPLPGANSVRPWCTLRILAEPIKRGLLRIEPNVRIGLKHSPREISIELGVDERHRPLHFVKRGVSAAASVVSATVSMVLGAGAAMRAAPSMA
jgi:hypothetical protein